MNAHRSVFLQGAQDIKTAYALLLQARSDRACQFSVMVMIDRVVCTVPIVQGHIDIDRAIPVQASGDTFTRSVNCPFIIL